jgi:hypothetical protein
MKQLVCIYLLLLLLPFGEVGRGLYAQNLVPNYSFEFQNDCDDNFLYVAVPWDGICGGGGQMVV